MLLFASNLYSLSVSSSHKSPALIITCPSVTVALSPSIIFDILYAEIKCAISSGADIAGNTYIYASPNNVSTIGYIFTILNFVNFRYISEAKTVTKTAVAKTKYPFFKNISFVCEIPIFT